jgi:hypothetical protein
MKKTIAVSIALAIGAVTPAAAFAGGRKGFCGYTACSELAEYVSRKGRLEWERCLAKEDRAIKGRAKR